MPHVRLILVLCIALATVTHAVEPAILLDADLREQKIQFMSYADETVRFFGEDRLLATLKRDKVVRIWFDGDALPADISLLRLADGQELRGRFESVTENGDLRWETDSLGTLTVTLDDVHSFVTDHAPASTVAADRLRTETSAAGGDADTVALTNGDRLSGFVEALTGRGVRLQRGDQTLDLPWDTVHGVTLANPVVHKPGFWVTLTDGSRIRVDSAQLTGRKVTGVFLGKPIETSDCRGLEFTFTQRLVPLGQLPRKVVAGGSAFGVEQPPLFESPTARLHAPLTLQFELPHGTRRFLARAHIAPDDLQWADMVLIISDSQGELDRRRLYAKQPDALINVEPRGPTLTLELDDAAGGPIRDRLTLTDAAVLVTYEP